MANDIYTANADGSCYVGMFAPVLQALDLVVAGDSLTSDAYVSAGFRWGAPLSRSPLKLVYNAGISNDTLDDLWNRWQDTVLDKLPNGGVIFLRIGTNSVTDAAFNSKYQRFVDSALSTSNIKMVMFALPPKAFDGARIINHNNFIASIPAQSPQRLFYIADGNQLGDSNYNYLQAYYSDQIHMNELGQYTMGLVQESAIRNIFGTHNPLQMTNDSYANNPSSTQFVSNPLNANAGQGWSNFTNAVTADAGDDNQTPWLERTMPSVTSNNQQFSISTMLNHPAISAGQYSKVRLTAELWFDDIDGDHIKFLSIYAFRVNDVFSTIWRFGLKGCGIVQQKVIVNQELALNPSFSYPANSITLRVFTEAFSTSPTSVGSLKIRNATVTAIA